VVRVSRPRAFGSIVLLVGWGIVGVALVSGYMVVRISAQGDRDEQRPADAIVVLGAAQFNGTPGGVFEARLQHAVDLYKAGVAKYLVVTGGKLPGDRTTEADTARKWAIAHGVPAKAILGENHGRNTLESLEAVAAIFRAEGLTSAVFVSDETHMLRVLRMASDQGIQAFGSPTRTSPTDRDPGRRRKAMLHEMAGLVAYYLGGSRLFEDAATVNTP
jgi:uncharacterized SAM-binding protein YcdF (DUF218 family)